jgi:competence protein ComEC
VIISLGAGNTYGHPHQHALDRISAAGTEHLFRKDVDGIIALTANSSSEYSIVTEKSMKKTFDVSKFETGRCSLQ